MRADSYFTEAEKQRIHDAVTDTETRTTGEIVPMIVTASARYTETELLGVVVGLAGGTLAALLLHDPWSIKLSHLYPMVGAVIGFLLLRIPALKRKLISQQRMDEAVLQRSLAAFTAEGLHYTDNHTGILIFVSLLEHEVEVLADQGINEKVPAGTWGEIASLLTEGMKTGQGCNAFCKAIERCGEILSAHFPTHPENRNELANRLVTKDR